MMRKLKWEHVSLKSNSCKDKTDPVNLVMTLHVTGSETHDTQIQFVGCYFISGLSHGPWSTGSSTRRHSTRSDCASWTRRWICAMPFLQQALARDTVIVHCSSTRWSNRTPYVAFVAGSVATSLHQSQWAERDHVSCNEPANLCLDVRQLCANTKAAFIYKIISSRGHEDAPGFKSLKPLALLKIIKPHSFSIAPL